MAHNYWPPLSVRGWSQVLAMRDPSWGSEPDHYDDISAAEESRRMHELRGLIVGQVAEIKTCSYISPIRSARAVFQSRSLQGRGDVG